MYRDNKRVNIIVQHLKMLSKWGDKDAYSLRIIYVIPSNKSLKPAHIFSNVMENLLVTYLI